MSLAPRARGILFAQLNALCGGTMMAIGKEVTREIPPQAFVALMYTIAAVVNTLWWYLTRIGVFPALHQAEDNHARRIPGSAGVGWLLSHTAASACGIITLWEGLARANAAAGSLLSRVEVVVAIILGLWLLKEHFTRWHWLGFGLTAAGMVIVRWAEFQANAEAFAWLLVGAVAFGVAEFTGKVAVKYWPVPRLVLIRAWLMWAVLCAMWYVRCPHLPTYSGDWSAGALWHTGTPAEYVGITAMGWFWLVVSALTGPVLARNFYMLSLSYLPVSQVVLLNQAQPLYAAIAGWWLRAEVPAVLFYAGAAAIIIGNLVLVRARERGK